MVELVIQEFHIILGVSTLLKSHGPYEANVQSTHSIANRADDILAESNVRITQQR